VVLAVLEEEQELGALGLERRTFLKETVELRIVETVKMIRKVGIPLTDWLYKDFTIIDFKVFGICQKPWPTYHLVQNVYYMSGYCN
jgi:hypothetical protein